VGDLDPKPTCVVGEFGFLAEKIAAGAGPVDHFTVGVLKTMLGNDLGHLLVEQEFTTTGRYTLNLPYQGELVSIEIDDYVPCVEGESAYVALGHGRALWPLLVRKAFAKLWGGYDAVPSDIIPRGDTTGPLYRLPNEEYEARGVLEGHMTALRGLFGSPFNEIDLPGEGTLLKASANSTLPLRSYVEANPVRPIWHRWFPKNPTFLLRPDVACVTVAKANKEDQDFVVVLLAGDAWSEAPEGMVGAMPWGQCQEWGFVDSYQSHKDKPTKDFALEEGRAYALAAFEADATAGMWGVKPAEWRWISLQLITAE